MSSAATPAAAPGLFTSFINAVKSEAIVIGDDIKSALVSIEPTAISDLDSLVTSLIPAATKGAQEVEASVASGAILSSEKRSALTTTLESQAQAAGYSLEQQGVSAAINIALEFGVNLFKMITGQALGTPANS